MGLRFPREFPVRSPGHASPSAREGLNKCRRCWDNRRDVRGAGVRGEEAEDAAGEVPRADEGAGSVIGASGPLRTTIEESEEIEESGVSRQKGARHDSVVPALLGLLTLSKNTTAFKFALSASVLALGKV